MRTLLPILLVCLLAVPALAEDLPSPTKAYNALVKKTRRMGEAQKAAHMKEQAEAYLAKWEAAGKKPTSKQQYSLALFHQAAGQFDKAAEGMRAVQQDKELKEKVEPAWWGGFLTTPLRRVDRSVGGSGDPPTISLRHANYALPSAP